MTEIHSTPLAELCAQLLFINSSLPRWSVVTPQCPVCTFK